MRGGCSSTSCRVTGRTASHARTWTSSSRRASPSATTCGCTSEELSEAAAGPPRRSTPGCATLDDTRGLAGTAATRLAVGEHGYEGGFTITASHNPARYNGMKMLRRGALPVGGESGLDRVRAAAPCAATSAPRLAPARDPAHLVDLQLAARCLSMIDPSAISPLNVVIDAANGTPSA